MRSVQNYEAGDVIPYKHFRRLEEITGKPLAWFLRGDENGCDTPAVERLESRLAHLEEMMQDLLAAVRPT